MKKLVACYIPGLDLRRIDAEQTPYMAEALSDRPWAMLKTVPSPEHLSTIITGQQPHRHEIWQTRLMRNGSRSLSQRLIDSLPDFVTTTAQSVIHQLTHGCDVPTIPPRRRRGFDFHRLKFRGRADTNDLKTQLGDVRSIVDLLGPEHSSYTFSDRLGDADRLIDRACENGARLEFVHFHALDMLGHWQIDTDEKFRRYYGLTDRFVRDLHRKCEANQSGMVLLTDHGQEPVVHSIDLARAIRKLDVPKTEYAYYLQPVMARFWFYTERAAAAIGHMLSALPYGTMLSHTDMHEHGVRFDDASFGELYFIADPGELFFPHDFHHPLVNFVFGLRDWQQRARLRNPRHIAYHGYLPHHPCEKGFMVMMDGQAKPDAPLIDLADVAPSLLDLMGRKIPDWMDGKGRFQRSTNP